MENQEILELATKEAEALKELLGVDANLNVTQEEGENEVTLIRVVFEGDDLGYMIGARGRHLMSLQYVLSNIVRNKVKAADPEQRVAILVDVGGYREQKQEKLESLAMQKADDARILGEPVDLMPMSAGDRRIVHMVLGKFDDIKTESFGDDADRHVRIVPLSEKELGIIPDSGDNLETDEEAEESE